MSVYIVKRKISPDPATGKPRTRWHVRYTQGRYEFRHLETGEHLLVITESDEGKVELIRARIYHLGTFDTEKRAKAKQQEARDEISAGRMPTKHPALAVKATTVRRVAKAWLATREEDAAESTLKGYRRSVATLPDWLAENDPNTLTHVEIQRFVTMLGKTFAPNTVRREIGALRQVLDYAGVRPNPAADKRVRLPRQQRREYRLPTRAQIAKMHSVMPSRSPLLTLLEHTGLRIEEAAALKWSDFDRTNGRERLRVRESKTAAGRRWVDRLPGAPAFPVPTERDRPEGLVFPDPSASSLTGTLRFMHIKYGTFMMSAHEWRHLHASRLLHEQALSPAQIAARLGHTNPSVLLTVYAHVVPPD